MTRVIAIANQKGGVGKTATAVNLATFIGLKRRTLLLDFDPQGHCAMSFALDPSLLTPTIYDVLFGRASARDAIRSLRENTSLLPAYKDLAIGEVELRDALRGEERLRRAIESVSGDFEYVVIDCPPSLGLLAINALLAAQTVIIPISSPMAHKGTTRLAELMDEINTAFDQSWDIYALQTFYRQGVRESESLRERLAKDFSDNLLDSKINLNTAISTAMGAGRPILDYPNTSGYLDYRRFAEEVINVSEAKQAVGGQAIGGRGGRQ
jgi:chromosome partitioning protein